jgi:hypothetical protein
VPSAPVVSTAEPSVTVPGDVEKSDPMVWLKLFKSRVPVPVTLNELLGENTLVAPARKVPALTVVAPA